MGIELGGLIRVLDRTPRPSRTSRLKPTQRPRASGLPHVYRGRAHKRWRDLYDNDHADAREGGRFRWLVSTFLAGAVGMLAIFVVIYGSSDQQDNTGGLVPTLKRMRDNASRPAVAPEARNRDGGLNWSAPRTDRLQIATGASSTRFIIHETLKQRRNGREYLHAKPYARIVARLAPVPANSPFSDVIPPFNPFKLYASNRVASAGEDEGEEASGTDRGDVAIRVVELIGGILPGEDGQELDTQEVADIVERTGGNKAAGAELATLAPAEARDPAGAPRAEAEA